MNRANILAQRQLLQNMLRAMLDETIVQPEPNPVVILPQELLRTELGNLSQDSQNVHTTHVNNQTNTNIKILLETPIPQSQHTLNEITAAIMKKRKKPTKYIEDMYLFYEKHTLLEADDYLYQRLLDGLWARIQLSPHKKELIKRLTEELREMNGKCTQGHITRVCNVMVGFDDSMQPIISQGELIQTRMSLISQKDITVEEKTMEALLFFQEIGVPAEEQNAWIEAFD